MKTDLDIKALGKQLADFLQRFHTLLFFLILGAAVATALLMVILTLGQAGNSTQDSANAINGNFDETTIQALREQEQSVNQPFQLPSGRTNPFVE